jgi:thymidylate kinase
MTRGVFISFEGGEGRAKSTQIDAAQPEEAIFSEIRKLLATRLSGRAS